MKILYNLSIGILLLNVPLFANTVSINTNRTMSYLLTNNVGGSGAGGILASADNLIIGNAVILTTRTITLTVDVSATVNSLNIGDVTALGSGQDDGVLTFSNASAVLTVTNSITLGDYSVLFLGTALGSINMTSGGTLTSDGFIDGVGPLGGLIWGGINTFTPGTGTIKLTATNTLPNSVIYTSYYNLTINGGTTSLARTTTVSGDLTISSGTLNSNGFDLTMSGSGKYWTNDVGIAGFTYGTRRVTFSGSVSIDGTGATDFYDITISGTLTGRPGAPVIGIQHSWTNNGTFTHGAGTVNFKGNNATSTIGGSVANTTFNNIIISGTNVAIGPTATSTFQVVGDWSNTGTYNARTGVVIFSGTGAQALSGSSDPVFYQIIVAKPTGTLTQSIPTVNVSSDFSISSGTFDLQTNTFMGTNSGVTVTATGGVWKIAKTGTTVPEISNVTKYNITGGRIVFYGAGNQTIKSLNKSGTSDQYYEIEIAGTSGTKTLGGGITVAQSVFITSTIFDAGGANTIFMSSTSGSGTWQNDASFTAQTSTVNFNGTGAQTIGGSVITTFHNLTINKASGTLTLNQSSTIDATGVLTLSSGPVALNKNTLSINNSATTAITRTTGYIISEDNSLTLTKANNASYLSWSIGNTLGAHVYPFANNAAVYIPFTYNLISGNVGVLSVSTYASAANNIPMPIGVSHVVDTTTSHADNSSYTVDRYWGISATNSSANADITFAYADGEIPAAGENGSDGKGMVAQQWSGNGWRYDNDPTAGVSWIAYYRNQTATPASNTVKMNGYASALNSIMPWTLALHAHPLPVELLAFKAYLNQQNQAAIEWKTAQEVNNDYFEVEKSLDGSDFASIERVEGHGNTYNVTVYKIVDHNTLGSNSKEAYYRLKQVDFDGQFTYTDIVSLTLCDFGINDGDKILNVFPNPTEGNTNISFRCSRDTKVDLLVYNTFGELVLKNTYEVILGDNQLNLEHTLLPTGNYLFIINADDFVKPVQGKFVKN